jgi:methionyl-tRNA synthetase
LADEEPWKMIKTDESRVQTQMYVALQIAAALSSLCEPFIYSKEIIKNLKIKVH